MGTSKRGTILGLVVLGVGIALLVGLVGQAFWRAPNLRLVAGESRVELVEMVDLTGEQQAGFAEWSARSDHFGAFAVGPGSLWGASWGNNDPDAAESSALSYCQTEQNRCRVVARMAPERPAEKGELVVSRPTLKSFVGYGAREGAKAFAISEAGEAGWAWGFSTPWQAEARALERCRFEASKEDDGERNTPCRVVHSIWW